MRIAILALLILFFYLSSILLIGENSYTVISSLKDNIIALEIRNQQVIKENNLLKEKIYALKNSEDYLEELTRNKLNLCKKKEYMYKIV